MANRFDRFNAIFDDEETDENSNSGEDVDETSSSSPDDERGDGFSSSSSSSSSSRSREPNKRRNGRGNDIAKFRVYANPFDKRADRHRKSKRRKRDKNKTSGMSSNVTVVVPPSSLSAAPPTGTSGGEWNPCSISEDVEVFRRYGVDPKHAHDHGDGGCYGCNVQCDTVPIKQSNMKVLLEKIAQSGVNSGNVLARAETIRSNYLDLIVEPKRKLKRLLNDRGPSSSSSSKHANEHEHEECEHGFEDDESRPNKSRRLSYQSSTKDLTKNGGGSSSNYSNSKEGDVDEWNTLKIYNHLRNHQMNVIEQVQYRRTQLWNIMNEMDRNSIFVEHGVKLNVFGEKLRQVDPDQFKIYLLAHREWLALSKSRPDLMRPFYDPDKVNSQGTANTREGEGNIINVSGQLLFGKRKK